MLKENIEALRWLISVGKGHRVYLLLSVFFALLGGGISIIPFLLFYEVVQAVTRGSLDAALVWNITLASLAAIVARYVLAYISTMCSHRAAFYIQYDLRIDIVEHVGKLHLGFFSKSSSGIFRKVASEDVEGLEIYIAHHVPDTVSSIAVPVAVFAVLFYLNSLLPLVLCLPIALMLFSLSASNKIRNKHVAEYFNNAEVMNSATVEYIKAIPIIKIFNISVESFVKFHESIRKQIEITSEWIRKSTPYYVLFKSSLDFSLPLLMFALSLYMYARWRIDIAAFVLCLVLSVSMARAINQIFTSSNLLCSLMEGAKRVERIMAMEPISESAWPAGQADDFAIRYDGVSFTYESTEVLHDINLNLAHNGLYALVGESGSGKTTTVQLLLRFWDVREGSISLGGVDIKKLPLEFLLRNIAFAFQDPFILDRTIRENIAMGCPIDSDEVIVEAAKTAEIHEVISRLPSGYDTVIGAGGSRLSGGEKQRICLARALVKKAPVLVLDEPTSQVDATIERKIFRTLKSHCADSIVIFVTHRLATAANADEIFIFEEGRIIASGSHDALLRGCGKYGRMWTLANKAGNWSFGARS